MSAVATTKLRKKIRDRRARRKRRIRRRPINVLASVFTTLCLYCGVVSIFASIRGNYERAVYLIVVAFVFDILDGSVARLTKSVSEFGRELDSLCDLVAFGVAPAVLIHTYFFPEGTAAAPGRLTSVLAILFVICGALRLARFNVYQAEQRLIFTGLPIPVAGGTLASFVLFANYFALDNALWLLCPLAVGLSYLMVSTVHFPKDKLKLFVLAPRHAFRMLATSAIAIALFHYASTRSPAVVLFPLGMAYVFFGIAHETLNYVKRRKRGVGEKETGLDTQSSEPPPGGPLPESKTGERL